MTSVILPSLTNQIVLDVFKILVDAEVRKRQAKSFEFCSGQQDGVILYHELLFGAAANDQQADEAANKNRSWDHVIEQIVEEKLKDWAETFEKIEDSSEINLEMFRIELERAVEEFALEKPELMIDALKLL